MNRSILIARITNILKEDKDMVRSLKATLARINKSIERKQKALEFLEKTDERYFDYHEFSKRFGIALHRCERVER